MSDRAPTETYSAANSPLYLAATGDAARAPRAAAESTAAGGTGTTAPKDETSTDRRRRLMWGIGTAQAARKGRR